LPEGDLDDLTFKVPKSEIQFLRNEASQVERVLQVRPLPGISQTFFIIDQGENDLNRFAVRRVAIHFRTRPFTRSPRPFFALEEMVFLVVSSGSVVSVAHFRGPNALAAHMAVSQLSVFEHAGDLADRLDWDTIVSEGVNLPEESYIRYERSRSGGRCSRGYLLANVPQKVALFDRALSEPSVVQEEEDRLFDHARAGGAWAVERLVTQNLRLVFDVSFRLCTSNSDCDVLFDDVFSGGLEGLLVALDKYEVARGHRFASYAWQWVATRAERMLVESLWPVNVPYYMWERLGPATRNFYEVQFLTDHFPGARPLDESLGLTEHQLEVARMIVHDSFEVADMNELKEVEDSCWACAFETVDDMQTIPTYLPALNERDRDVLLYRFGLHPKSWDRKLTLEEVAAKYSVTRERARQIEMKALKKIRIALAQ